MFNEDLQKYKNAFVFGTGGGNDIVSSVLVALYLQKQGIKTDIGGILSPAVVHTFNGNLEQVINEVKGEVKRIIPSKESVELSFIDAHLPEFVKQSGVNIQNYYDLSIRYGTTALVNASFVIS